MVHQGAPRVVKTGPRANFPRNTPNPTLDLRDSLSGSFSPKVLCTLCLQLKTSSNRPKLPQLAWVEKGTIQASPRTRGSTWNLTEKLPAIWWQLGEGRRDNSIAYMPRQSGKKHLFKSE
jgi:hypothetical protein